MMTTSLDLLNKIDPFKIECLKSLQAEADKLESEAKEADRKSEVEMHVHERWAMATTLLQIAIALSAITLLTRKRWLLAGVFGATGLGLLAGVMGYLHL